MNMRRYTLSSVGVGLLLAVGSFAQTTITSQAKPYVDFLASEALQGREAGSEGERLAADYIATQLRRIGARPLPGRSDLFMPFEFTAGSRDGGSRMTVGG